MGRSKHEYERIREERITYDKVAEEYLLSDYMEYLDEIYGSGYAEYLLKSDKCAFNLGFQEYKENNDL